MTRRVRAADVALLTLAVAVLVFVGVTLQRFSSPVVEPGAAALPQSGSGVQELEAPPRLLVVGDELVAGAGASRPGNGFAQVLADRLGGPHTVDAEPDSGYVARGSRPGDDDSFPARIEQIAERGGPGYDLVVVAGGHEDHVASPGRLREAVEQVARRVEQAWPDAQLVLLGSTRAFPESQVLVPLHRTIRAGAEAAGVPFVDPVAEAWIDADNTDELISGDLFHPNDAGHALLADRLLEHVRALPAR